MGKTMNSQMQETFEWLRSQGLPPLPVAPAQDANRYPARDRNGNLQQDKQGMLMPAFTGKNPSYLDDSGIPHLIRHKQYQNRLPSQLELQTWFVNPANGIGTLGGWHNLVWIDLDVKQFESRQDCDQRVAQWLGQDPILKQTFTERTHSGGWRFAVRVHEKTFTNFSLDRVGGQHVGEALGQGRFTVLAPTVGPSGNAYINVQRMPPVWIERLEEIGLYPVSGRTEQCLLRQPRLRINVQSDQPGVLRLEDLATAKAQAVLHGESPLESRSHSLTYALREFYGWENWAAQNQIPMSGNAEDLARSAGAALGIDSDRTKRIIESVSNSEKCSPAVVFAGGEANAWKRIWKLDRLTYQNFCPQDIKQVLNVSARKNYKHFFQNKIISHENHLNKGPQPILSENLFQPSALASTEEIQVFVRCVWQILASHGSLPIPPENHLQKRKSRKCIQGQTYQIVAEGQDLVVKAQDNRIILQTRGNNIIKAEPNKIDLLRFQAEITRLYQTPSTGPKHSFISRDHSLE